MISTPSQRQRRQRVQRGPTELQQGLERTSARAVGHPTSLYQGASLLADPSGCRWGFIHPQMGHQWEHQETHMETQNQGNGSEEVNRSIYVLSSLPFSVPFMSKTSMNSQPPTVSPPICIWKKPSKQPMVPQIRLKFENPDSSQSQVSILILPPCFQVLESHVRRLTSRPTPKPLKLESLQIHLPASLGLALPYYARAPGLRIVKSSPVCKRALERSYESLHLQIFCHQCCTNVQVT